MEWKEQLEAYVPQTEEETCAKQEFLDAADKYGTELFLRECAAGGHVTCSSMILDESMEYALMVHHNIYQSFAWTGGHADGDTDFLAVAIREAKEETGITVAEPLCSEILSLDILPVAAHEKHGYPVDAHVHYNVSYGLLSLKKEKLRVKPDENSAVEWIPIEKLGEVCREKNMLPVYEKLIQRMHRIRREQQDVLRKSAEPLCAWYQENARDLPWRRDRDPYHVWVSEVMLQQTRVEVVREYYDRFLEIFPTVQELAQADEEQVHKAWEGLGYYTRAKNLRLTAKEICRSYGGEFPRSFEELRGLPGVGDYTAGAICSISFGQPVAAVDGNVMRVTERLQDSFGEIERLGVKRRMMEELGDAYPKDDGARCGILTQAIMELGATVCIPNGEPHCDVCPLRELCRSWKNQTYHLLPVRKPKAPKKKVPVTVMIMCYNGYYAVCQRPLYGLLAGLWEFPNLEQRMTDQEVIHQAETWGCKPVSITRTLDQIHVFTHRQWEMKGYYIECENPSNLFQWKRMAEIQAKLTVPSAFQKFFP